MSKYITKTPVRVPMVLPPSMVASTNDTIDELSSVGDAGINTNTGSCSDDEIKYRKTYHKLSEEEAIPASLVTFGSSITMDTAMFTSFFEKREVERRSFSQFVVSKYEEQNNHQVKQQNKTISIA